VIRTSLVSVQQAEPPAEPLREPLASEERSVADGAPVAARGVPTGGGENAAAAPPEEEEVAPEVLAEEVPTERDPSAPEGASRDELPAEDGASEDGASEDGASEDERGAGELETPTSPTLEPEAAPETGVLVIVAEPWARVRVDGEAVGTTPLGALTLAAGRHVVTLDNPDFPTHSVEVAVEGGEEARLAVSLWELVGRVSLVVSPWAEVAVDGRYWDTVPPQERPLVLVPGTHRLTFTHPALGTRETTLRIAAGESRTLRVNLNVPSEAAPAAGGGREGVP
jgi:serine/threonine-protein kinase